MNILKTTFLAVFVLIFSFFNFLDVTFLGVKPNFSLAAIIAIMFFVDDIFEGMFLISLSSLVLKFSPVAGKDILVYFFVCAVALLLKKYLPWHNFLINLFLVFFSTFLFYALLFFDSIASFIFLKEIIYNIITSSFVFVALSQFKIFNSPTEKIFNNK